MDTSSLPCEVLKRLRSNQGKSLRQLSLKTGIARSTLSRWELGKGAPTAAEAEAIGRALGCVEHLVGVYKSTESSSIRAAKARRRLLRAIRIRQGLQLQEAAVKVGITKAALSRWENGERTPSPERLARASAALGAAEHEIEAFVSERPLFPTSRRPVDEIHKEVVVLRSSIVKVPSPVRDVVFIGLDAELSVFPAEAAKRLRLHLRAAYIEWLGWWYRDEEAANLAKKLLPAVSKFPDEPVWGRIVRAAANWEREKANNPFQALDMLEHVATAVKGLGSEGFVLRELAGTLMSVGCTYGLEGQLERVGEAPNLEESPETHRFCCATLAASFHSLQGDHEKALGIMPSRRPEDAYLASSTAVGRFSLMNRVGLKAEAETELVNALTASDEARLPHFSAGIRRRLDAFRSTNS